MVLCRAGPEKLHNLFGRSGFSLTCLSNQWLLQQLPCQAVAALGQPERSHGGQRANGLPSLPCGWVFWDVTCLGP